MLSKLKKLFGASGNPAPAKADAPRSAWKQHGNASMAQGDLDTAAAHYRQGIAEEPANAQPYLNLGYCLLELGKPAAAEEVLQQALRHAPARSIEAFETCHMLARAREEQGDPTGSAAHLQQAVQHGPDQFSGWASLGRIQAGLGQTTAAMDSLHRAIALQPEAVAEMDLLCTLLLQQRLPEQLLTWARRILVLAPGHLMGHIHAGQALNMLRQFDAALLHIEAAEALGTANANYWCLRAGVLHALRRLPEAMAAYQAALRIEPTHLTALVKQSEMACALGQRQHSLALAQSAASLTPVTQEDHTRLAAVLNDLGRYTECLAVCEKGLSAWPQSAELAFAQACAKLVLGQLPDAWAGYERRFDLLVQVGLELPSGHRWTGQDLHGKTLLLWGEQGLGDSIQMLRCLPWLCGQGATVYLDIQSSLVPLVESMQTSAVLLGEGKVPPRYDYYCPLMSLPFALQLTEATLPAQVPYVHVAAASRQAWSDKLGPRRRPRLGMVWSGNPNHVNDANRSLPLKALLDAIPLGWDVFSLQKELRGDDAQVIEASGRVRHFGEDLHGFMDTAALASEMDLVISVDTSVAHLVGALGRPLWLLLPHNPDWRWIVGRDTTPWYPTAKLFRQTIDQLPTDLLERIGHELTAELARVSTAPG